MERGRHLGTSRHQLWHRRGTVSRQGHSGDGNPRSGLSSGRPRLPRPELHRRLRLRGRPGHSCRPPGRRGSLPAALTRRPSGDNQRAAFWVDQDGVFHTLWSGDCNEAGVSVRRHLRQPMSSSVTLGQRSGWRGAWVCTRPRDTRDFEIGKRLVNLPALREIGFHANRRLLGVQRLDHDPITGTRDAPSPTQSPPTKAPVSPGCAWDSNVATPCCPRY